jgi:hypothetical protein
MLYPESVARMAETVPDAYLITILREPIERAFSQYRMNAHFRWDRRTFDEAVLDELEAAGAESTLSRAARTGRAEHHYLARGDYRPQLERLCHYFPRERLLVLFLEDLASDPTGTFASVCRFLGINDQEQPDVVGRLFNTAGDQRLVNPFSVRRRLLYRFRLWRFLPRPISVRLSQTRGSEQAPAQPAAPGTVDALREYFETRNAALADWLGHDLSHWRVAPRIPVRSAAPRATAPG